MIFEDWREQRKKEGKIKDPSLSVFCILYKGSTAVPGLQHDYYTAREEGRRKKDTAGLERGRQTPVTNV